MKALRQEARRTGYKGTGFAFTFVRCPTAKDLEAYVSKLPGVPAQEWFGRPAQRPAGFTTMYASGVLPIIEEAVDEYLCDINIVVVACDNPREERRHWYHEIGHAVEFAKEKYWYAFKTGNKKQHEATKKDYSLLIDSLMPEFSAYCTEYLCDAYDAWRSGAICESGFLRLFPWLEEKKNA